MYFNRNKPTQEFSFLCIDIMYANTHVTITRNSCALWIICIYKLVKRIRPDRGNATYQRGPSDLYPTLIQHRPRLHTNSETTNLLCLFFPKARNNAFAIMRQNIETQWTHSVAVVTSSAGNYQTAPVKHCLQICSHSFKLRPKINIFAKETNVWTNIRLQLCSLSRDT